MTEADTGGGGTATLHARPGTEVVCHVNGIFPPIFAQTILRLVRHEARAIAPNCAICMVVVAVGRARVSVPALARKWLLTRP